MDRLLTLCLLCVVLFCSGNNICFVFCQWLIVICLVRGKELRGMICQWEVGHTHCLQNGLRAIDSSFKLRTLSQGNGELIVCSATVV